ncbi:cysteine dioxygenase family protein [Streptomyces sp. NPDC048384]|uniref:cysteine dioxygenase family protein n=1 Tax=Streptomyces sp. NPDC048384 TaxID=3155487 RepID=UPI003412EF2E
MTSASTAPGAFTAARTTDRLDALLAGLREDVGRGLPPDLTAHLVGERLAPHLGAPDLLTDEQQQSDPTQYRQHLLHAEHDGSFSVVALVWLPGQGTSVHDHVSWCTTGVHQGQERERRYRLLPAADGAARLVATTDVLNKQGEFCGFAPPGDIHRVWNAGPSTAISLHVYGADISRLGSSVRRVYQLPTDC